MIYDFCQALSCLSIPHSHLAHTHTSLAHFVLAWQQQEFSLSSRASLSLCFYFYCFYFHCLFDARAFTRCLCYYYKQQQSKSCVRAPQLSACICVCVCARSTKVGAAAELESKRRRTTTTATTTTSSKARTKDARKQEKKVGHRLNFLWVSLVCLLCAIRWSLCLVFWLKFVQSKCASEARLSWQKRQRARKKRGSIKLCSCLYKVYIRRRIVVNAVGSKQVHYEMTWAHHHCCCCCFTQKVNQLTWFAIHQTNSLLLWWNLSDFELSLFVVCVCLASWLREALKCVCFLFEPSFVWSKLGAELENHRCALSLSDQSRAQI